jgi:hypothetical protein
MFFANFALLIEHLSAVGLAVALVDKAIITERHAMYDLLKDARFARLRFFFGGRAAPLAQMLSIQNESSEASVASLS